jgi:hypothetical protein
MSPPPILLWRNSFSIFSILIFVFAHKANERVSECIVIVQQIANERKVMDRLLLTFIYAEEQISCVCGVESQKCKNNKNELKFLRFIHSHTQNLMEFTFIALKMDSKIALSLLFDFFILFFLVAKFIWVNCK